VDEPKKQQQQQSQQERLVDGGEAPMTAPEPTPPPSGDIKTVASSSLASYSEGFPSSLGESVATSTGKKRATATHTTHLDYKHYLKEFYTILACRSVKSDSANASLANKEDDKDDEYKKAKTLTTASSIVNKQKNSHINENGSSSSTLSTLTSAASSLRSIHRVSEQLLKTLTVERVRPIELTAEDFDHDDYIDLSFTSENTKAYYEAQLLSQGESKRCSFVSTSGAAANNIATTNRKPLLPFNFKSCFFNTNQNGGRDAESSQKTSIAGEDEDQSEMVVVDGVGKAAIASLDDTDLGSEIDSEFDAEFSRPKLYGSTFGYIFFKTSRVFRRLLTWSWIFELYFLC
jgi:hypothetical protein